MSMILKVYGISGRSEAAATIPPMRDTRSWSAGSLTRRYFASSLLAYSRPMRTSSSVLCAQLRPAPSITRTIPTTHTRATRMLSGHRIDSLGISCHRNCNLLHFTFPERGDTPHRVHKIGGLIAPAAIRLWGEHRRIRLHEQELIGDVLCDRCRLLRVTKGHGSGDRDQIPSCRAQLSNIHRPRERMQDDRTGLLSRQQLQYLRVGIAAMDDEWHL